MSYHFAAVNGTKIHYEEQGLAPTADSEQTVLLIHAGVVNLGMWEAQMGPFARHHRVIRYDVRGWGETAEPPLPYSDHEDLRSLLDHLGITQAVLVGCSHGGKIALDFALAYPEMVSGLVLVGSGLGGYKFTMEGMTEKVEAMRAAYERGEIDLAAEISTQVWYDGLTRSPEQVEASGRVKINQMIRHTFHLPEGGGQLQELSPPAINRLGEINVPALIIVGDQDAPDIQRIAGLLQEKLPSARKIILADTAHFPNMEKSAEFNRIVLAFLEQI